VTFKIKNLFKDNHVVRLEHDLDEIRLKNPYLFKKNLNDLGITHPNLTKSKKRKIRKRPIKRAWS
jgi:hypothetical protein